MQFIYTTGWTREKVRTEKGYTEWLRSLKNGDHVLKQSFQPANNGILDYPIDRWEFERVKVWNNRLDTRGDCSPFDPTTGKCKYWGSDSDWGNVFPARIIPVHNDLPTKELGDRLWGHLPVYEPLFLNANRLVFLVERGPGFSQNNSLVKKVFEYSYRLEVSEGDLHHCFTQDEHKESDRKIKDLANAGIRFLYSQYCKP